ncbi:ATP-binding cassette domain-containing protein [Comamonas flocculans]|uniref:ATP-binding cassette domain-containing protein n=1 Tax=Comamonas flocculans TaxID=2597701 RepID=A0A5B8RYN7_9BURK|nr:ATP-binding cassette domain-containing protein [Comamonas flocculans]QEA12947.1 ATP-binding cassette domain-containing protein [Comamonas flocculans]
MSLLQASGLRKSFGGVHAVQGVSLQVRAGELLALIGPNGAGKSTTFQLIGGQLRPDAGRVLLDGADITGVAARELARRGVGRTFQIAETLASFTALANVQMALLAHDGRWRGLWRGAGGYRRQDALALLAQVGMQAQADRPCRELAYGDVKRLELALALAGTPRLLLMDEPTAGMAPAERGALMQLVRELARERQIGVLFTEHSMDVVFAHADRVAVMVRGELLAEGPPAAMRANSQVQQAYLGSGLQAPGSPPTLPVAEQPMERAPLLRVRDLQAWYGAAQALHGVSLTVRPGEVLALMGRNGAGKSTTLKAIAGLMARSGGSRHFMGEDIGRWSAHRIARAGLGYVPEERRIFGDLTVLENLEAGRQSPRRWPGGTPLPPWTVQRLFALFPNLGEMPERRGARMSGGEQQMLTVARTLMGQPYLVLLDEPSEGVAPLIVEQMARAVRELKAQGMGILLCEQNLAFAQAVADHVVVLEQGRVVHAGDMAGFMADAALRRRHLGL